MNIRLLKTTFLRPRLLALLALASLLPCTASAQAPNAARVAALEQEVAELRTELRKIREEMQDLRTLVNRSASGPKTGTANTATVQSLINAQAVATGDALKSVESRGRIYTDKRVAELAQDVKKALDDQAKQVNAALATRPGPVRNADTDRGTVRPPPADVPKTGIPYKVKRGDTLDKIAHANRSRTSWIVAANSRFGLTEKSILKIGQELFIPQQEKSTPPPPPPPPPPPDASGAN